MGDMNVGDMDAAGGLGLAALSGIAKYKNANAQHEQAKLKASLDSQSAQSALTSTLRSLESEKKTAAEQSISTSIAVQKASAIAKGQARAEAGASGMGGSAVTKVESSVSMDASRTLSKSAMNLEGKNQELSNSATIATAQAKGRMRPQSLQAPNPWAIGLEAGVSGFRNVVSIKGLQKERENL